MFAQIVQAHEWRPAHAPVVADDGKPHGHRTVHDEVEGGCLTRHADVGGDGTWAVLSDHQKQVFADAYRVGDIRRPSGPVDEDALAQVALGPDHSRVRRVGSCNHCPIMAATA